MSRRTQILIACLCAWGAWHSWRYRELRHPPGVLVTAEPEQVRAGPDVASVRRDRFVLKPRAAYRLTVRLLSRERYRLDEGADLAPLDFAVGWGPMSDSAVLDTLKLNQSGRFFHLTWQTPPIPEREIMDHAANMHLIAADDGVARALDRMRPGQIIHLEGWLVDAMRNDGWHWETSMTREDGGDGACELMLVDAATVL